MLEGPDGVGKSTAASAFAAGLESLGIPTAVLSFPGSEPGSLGRLVNRVHHAPLDLGVESIHAASLQVLHIAAHIDCIEQRIRPLLAQGTTVVLDRFWWSTWVYGQLAGVPLRSLDAMIALEQVHWTGITPSRVFLLLADSPHDDSVAVSSFRALRKLYLTLFEASGVPAAQLVDARGNADSVVAALLSAALERSA